MQFGRLTAVALLARRPFAYRCVCHCGRNVVALERELRDGSIWGLPRLHVARVHVDGLAAQHGTRDHREGRVITVYTWGYQGRRLLELLELQQRLNALVVDTRYLPTSRNAAFRRSTLERRLGRNYLWMQSFGNLEFRSATKVRLVDPGEGLRLLEPHISPGRPPLLLCMCRIGENCHRADVARFLEAARGWSVVHLADSASQEDRR